MRDKIVFQLTFRIHWNALCNYNSQGAHKHILNCLEFEEHLANIRLYHDFNLSKKNRELVLYTSDTVKNLQHCTHTHTRTPISIDINTINIFHLQVITVACLYLHQADLHNSDHVSLLATVTFVCYTIILLILLIGKMIDIVYCFHA